MSSKEQNLSTANFQISKKDIESVRVGIVVSSWNKKVTFSLLDACKATLLDNGVSGNNISILEVPGAFELPLAAKYMLAKDKMDGVVCLGCIIKGETKHDEYISHAVAQGIMNLSLTSSNPVIFGVLTPNTMEQALDRAGGKHGNKGVEAAQTVLKMIELKDAKDENAKSIGF